MHFFEFMILFFKIHLKGSETMYLRRLKDLREDNDEKQIAIANLLNITRQQYSLYETGKRDLPIKYLKILAEFYNTSTDYILEVTDDSKPYKKI
mgnify:CR=1 FL=1